MRKLTLQRRFDITASALAKWAREENGFTGVLHIKDEDQLRLLYLHTLSERYSIPASRIIAMACQYATWLTASKTKGKTLRPSALGFIPRMLVSKPVLEQIEENIEQAQLEYFNDLQEAQIQVYFKEEEIRLTHAGDIREAEDLDTWSNSYSSKTLANRSKRAAAIKALQAMKAYRGNPFRLTNTRLVEQADIEEDKDED
jgi:hypothetical protein